MNAYRHAIRFVVAILGLILCGMLIMRAGTVGLSRFFTAAAVIQSAVEPADIAVRVSPGDPEAHYTRGLELVNMNRTAEAVVELEAATRLRPHHYYEWLDLGVTLDRTGDQTGALTALRKSVQMAPHFAQPRWQLGNLLYRQGVFEDAFDELRLASKSNPDLVETLMDLAWAAAEGNVEHMRLLVEARTARSHLQLAHFFASHGSPRAAVEEVNQAGANTESEIVLTHQIVVDLLNAGSFEEAYEAWEITHQLPVKGRTERFAELLNGDFLEPIVQSDPGFGWQPHSLPNVTIAIDPSGPAAGKRSVRVDFGGDSPNNSWILSQIVLVRPKTEYSIQFKAKTEKLITGGLPVIAVVDAADSKMLAQSTPQISSSSDWGSYKVNFSTGERTSAVIVTLQRLPCSQSPCPIFGKLWLSGFSFTK